MKYRSLQCYDGPENNSKTQWETGFLGENCSFLIIFDNNLTASCSILND
jgi:hypothetical protein